MKINENKTMKSLPENPKPSSDTYRVPTGFFEEFPEKIISHGSRFDANHVKTGYNWISIAAVFSVLALSAGLIYQQFQSNEFVSEPSVDDLAHYLVLEGASHEELAQQVISESMDELSDESQSEDIYESYLLEQEIDINHLNEEL